MLVEVDRSPKPRLRHRPIEIAPEEAYNRRQGGIVVWGLHHLARLARRRSAVHQAEDLERTTDTDHYRSWRYRELQQQLTSHFDTTRIADLDVLDFGCGTGELCQILALCKPKSLTGIDQSLEAIRRATDASQSGRSVEASTVSKKTVGVLAPLLAKEGLGEVLFRSNNPPRSPLGKGGGKSVNLSRNGTRFLCNAGHETVPLQDASMDLICCFDVVEHIPDPRRVLEEWNRVLRPDGRVWIWWSPWRGPFGHHLESLLPLPWIHLVLAERTIFKACAAIYDDPDFVPRHWDMDPVTGNRKPNKWSSTTSFSPFLNKLTRVQFERFVRTCGLEITRREIHGFAGSRLRRATRVMLPIPWIGDCVVSYYVYELAKQH